MTQDAREPGVVTKFIEPKISLMWLLSAMATAIVFGGTLLWNIGLQSAKIDELLVQTQKLEKRLDDRDVRSDRIMQMIYSIRQVNDAQGFRLDDIERRLNAMTARQGK
jgi:hypothetical protein